MNSKEINRSQVLKYLIQVFVFTGCLFALGATPPTEGGREVECRLVDLSKSTTQNFVLQVEPGVTDSNTFSIEKDKIILRSEDTVRAEVAWKSDASGTQVPLFKLTRKNKRLSDIQLLLWNKKSSTEARSEISFDLPKLAPASRHEVLWQTWLAGDEAVFGADILDADTRIYCILKQKGESISSLEIDPIRGGAIFPKGGAVESLERRALTEAQIPIMEKIKASFSKKWDAISKSASRAAGGLFQKSDDTSGETEIGK